MSAGVGSDLEETYNDDYQAGWLADSERSAAVVVPILLRLFPWVRSVVDIGCGPAAWLLRFQIAGVSRVLGLDGANIAPRLLQVDPQDFRRVDLRDAFAPSEPFDMAISLETANCLPESEAEQFVAQLSKSSDVIAFSAAVPGQSGGVNANERWQSYWVSLFSSHGFQHFDLVRASVWYDQRVSWWYAQNMLIFVRQSRTDLVEPLQSLLGADKGPVDIVHPSAYARLQGGASLEKVEGEWLYPFRLVERDYDRFNILKIDENKFLALHQDEGEYRPELLLSGKYGAAYVADSIDAAKALVDLQKWTLKLVEKDYRGFDIYQKGVDHFVAVPVNDSPDWLARLASGDLDRVYFGKTVVMVKRKIPLSLWLRSRIGC